MVPGYPLVRFCLHGREILNVLEQILEMKVNDFFVQVSGMRYSYNPQGETGKRVTAIETEYARGKWARLDPARLYRIATNYYTASFLEFFKIKPRDWTGKVVALPTCFVDAEPAVPGV